MLEQIAKEDEKETINTIETWKWLAHSRKIERRYKSLVHRMSRTGHNYQLYEGEDNEYKH